MTIEFVSKNKDGNFYIGYKVNVARGIRGKDKGHVDELIIIGLNKEKFQEFVIQHKEDFEDFERRNNK